MPPVRGRKRSIARHFYLELTFSRPDIKPTDFSVNSFAWDDTDVSVSEQQPLQQSGNVSSSSSRPISRNSSIAPNIYITVPEGMGSIASSSGLSPTTSYDPYGRRKRIKVESGDDPTATGANELDLLPGNDDYLFSKIESSLDASKDAVAAAVGEQMGDSDVMNLPIGSNHRGLMMSGNIVSPHPISYEQQQQQQHQQQQQQQQQQQIHHQQQHQHQQQQKQQQQHQQQPQHQQRHQQLPQPQPPPHQSIPPPLISSHTSNVDLPIPQRQYNPHLWSTNIQNLSAINTSNLENIESFTNPAGNLSAYGQPQSSQLVTFPTHDYSESNTPPPLPPAPTRQLPSHSSPSQTPGSTTTFFYCLLCKHIYSSNNRNNNMNRHFYDNHLRTQGKRLREYLLNLADELEQKENTDTIRERETGR